MKRPLCPKCDQPLRGKLAATGCGYVFHKDCLEARSKCAQCGEVHSADTVLDLFGVTFGEAGPLRPEQLVEHIADDEDSPGVEASEEAKAERAARLRRAAGLLQRQQEAREMQRRCTEDRDKAETLRRDAERQREKHDAAKRHLAKRKAEVERLRKACAKETSRYDELAERLNAARRRDCAFDYWELIKQNDHDAALRYLTRTVNLGGSPWRITAEVLKLTQHVRSERNRWLGNGAACDKRRKDAERQLAEVERSIAEVERQLEAIRDGPNGRAASADGRPGLKRKLSAN